MIIARYNQMFDAIAFAEGLRRAIRGVVKVSAYTTDPAIPTQMCTGWLITDWLVIVPAYAINQRKNLLCQHHEMEGEQIEATVTSDISIEPGIFSNPNPSPDAVGGPALLRLSKPMAGFALTLETKIPAEGDGICLLQYVGQSRNMQISTGYITGSTDTWIGYNADTLQGAGGCPVINVSTWNVIGLHMLASREFTENRGLRLDPMLDYLKQTPYWQEIASYHRIADTASIISVPQAEQTPSYSDAVIEAALSWNFKADHFDESDKNQLQPLVVNARSKTWTLKTEERRRILQNAGPLDVLRKKKTPVSVHPGQPVINRILDGPPFDIEKISEEELPYWLQAVRWFNDIVPGIPTAADIETAIEKRNTRGRLSKIIAGFQGRKYELDELQKWFESDTAGPLVVSGVGGIGKSALVAYFINELPENCLFIWLDFDRVDLVADDAVSILKAILEQAAVQIEALSKSDINFKEDWKTGATLLGKHIASATKNLPNPLIVLDGFEIAQRAGKYQDIWKVLNQLMEAAPMLKVIVSGRAPVKNLNLGDKDAESLQLKALRPEDAESLPLKGLQPEDAVAWLHANGVSDEKSVSKIIELADGIPLRLKLAVQYLKTDDDPNKLNDLPKAMIEGYLYTRILDRIIDPQLEKLVKDILVLRKCSAPMIAELFGELLPPGVAADEAYKRLSREMALVDEKKSQNPSFVMSGDMLELRPEVRSATLRLLEMENLSHVQEVDRKAADWYRKQDLVNVENLAELIYHLLRSGQLDEAKKLWRFECVRLLKYAVDDLPETAHAERAWLSEQVGSDTGETEDNIVAWESDVALELRDRFSRGVVHGLDEILSDKSQRSEASPLIVYDAWNCWKKGHPEEGIKLLELAKPMDGPIQFSRNIMNAFLNSKMGAFERADDILKETENGKHRGGLPDSSVEIMALRAARVRLMVDIDAELQLFEAIKTNSNTNIIDVLGQFLTQSDIVSPLLNEIFATQVIHESIGLDLSAPANSDQLDDFKKTLQQRRFPRAPFAASLDSDMTYGVFEAFHRNILDKASAKSDAPIGPFPIEEAFKIAYKGYRRWRMATSDLMLADFIGLLKNSGEVIDPLKLSVISTLAAFRGEMIAIPSHRNAFIDRVLQSMVRRYKLFSPPPDDERIKLLVWFCETNKQYESSYSYMSDILLDFIEKERNSTSPSFQVLAKIDWPALVSLVLYLYGPDPLEMLLRFVLGFSDNSKLD